MGPGPFGARDLFGGGCKTVWEIIERGFFFLWHNVKWEDMGI